MAEKNAAIGVTPGQAKWIVERMIAARRISVAEVRSILADMGSDIAELERRLAARHFPLEPGLIATRVTAASL